LQPANRIDFTKNTVTVWSRFNELDVRVSMVLAEIYEASSVSLNVGGELVSLKASEIF
jgi:hypothetical protein